MPSVLFLFFVLTACGGEPTPPAPQVDAPAPVPPKKTKLEPPPLDTYQGQSRVVNLYVDQNGATKKVDVWAKRSFTHAEVLLAEGVAPGNASDWFGIPAHSSVVVVEAGAGATGDEVGSLSAPRADEAITHLLQLGRSGKPEVTSLYEAGATSMNHAQPAPEGQGMVALFAGQLRAHSTALQATTGGHAYDVGTGMGACSPRRGVDPNAKGTLLLGGTTTFTHDLDPGKTLFRLHSRDNKTRCTGPGVFDFEVDVAANSRTLVLIYTDDLKGLKALQLPMAE